MFRQPISPALESKTHILKKYRAYASSRLHSLDILRGISVIGMGFVHSREFVGSNNYSNLDWNVPATWQGQRTLDFIQQAFMSSVGASGFFMLMGISLILFYRARLVHGWSIAKICYHLILRGTVLILVQMIILQAFEIYTRQQMLIYVGVLAALGGCMVISAILILVMHYVKSYFNNDFIFYLLPSLISMITVFYINDSILAIQRGTAFINGWKTLFFLSGHYQLPSGIDLDVNFTSLPWLPIVCVGLVIGQLIYKFPEYIQRISLMGAFAALSTWFLIRTANIYHYFNFGEYKLTPLNQSVQLSDYFCMSKYPPSVSLILWSVGVNLIFIHLLYKHEQSSVLPFTMMKPIIIFGQCSLLFFILHWFVYYGWSLMIPTPIHSTLLLLLFAFLGIISLYPICKNYRDFKRRLPEESILRLF